MRLCFCFLLLLSARFDLCAQAVAPGGGAGNSNKLAFLVESLVNSALERNEVPASLRPLFQERLGAQFGSLNQGVAQALSNLPLPSPASGVNYTYNQALGVYVPSQQSLGPLLAERAETIGRRKAHVAVSMQRFAFDRLDDVDFRNFQTGVPLAIPVLGSEIPALLAANTTIKLDISQFTAHFTYGLTHNIDVSYALPVVSTSMTVTSQGSLLGLPASFAQTRVSGASTGLGDGVARVKARLLKKSGVGLAAAADLRLPTGDALNYRGAGAVGFKPFVVASATKGIFSPHLNIGYQWNGSSYLGTPSGRMKARLPSQALVNAGVEVRLTKRVTAAGGIIDQIVRDGTSTILREATWVDGSRYEEFSFVRKTHHEVSASVGLKVQITEGLILSGNLLFRLNDAGLRAGVVPFGGVSAIR